MGLSPLHILVVIFVVLILFGPSRIARLGKGLGEGLRNFRVGLRDDAPERLSSGPERS